MLTTLDHFNPGLDFCPFPSPPHSLPGTLTSPQVAESSPLFRPGCGDVSRANAEWHVRFVSEVRIRLRKSGTSGRLGNLQIGCGSLEIMFQACQLFCGTNAGLIKVLDEWKLLAVCWLCWVLGSFRNLLTLLEDCDACKQNKVNVQFAC